LPQQKKESKLKTNLEGLYAAGDQLFASDCNGHAATTGHYAGRHAADYAKRSSAIIIDKKQVEKEKNRIHSIFDGENRRGRKEFNLRIIRIMQNCCGAVKSENLLKIGLSLLENMRVNEVLMLHAQNPHELIQSLEVLSILTNAILVIHSCLARKASSKQLHFQRSDYTEMDPSEWHKFISLKLENNQVKIDEKSIDYYGSLKENYELHNQDYIKERGE
jgi:succinate dehydrogenase/fumarate reductase flavoprotein subunit